ncbi:hypothetical protein ACTS9V_08830 [Empedobacter falsenii]|uniref:Uncharacterized protein n=1 Tax=Empedobacter falsenii TaxID=343874 RepID=A0A7H9DPS0_9FLAO|nr:MULTISPECIES: hypothetical protein [Empedobacter]MDH2206358.1 hypothetical protein [Empedobacter sp. GD03644]QLL56916.1 hypothetical protein FH779_01900 [Empedobacter falsenii]
MKYIYATLQLLIITISFNCKSSSVLPNANSEFSNLKINSRLIDKNEDKLVDSFELFINDSIQTKIKKYNLKIEATNYFKKSKAEVKITFYEENSVLNLIRIKEESNKHDETDKYIDYMIENNKIKDFHLYYGHQLGLPLDLNKSIYEQYGLNQFLTEDFYRNFSFEIYKKLNK